MLPHVSSENKSAAGGRGTRVKAFVINLQRSGQRRSAMAAKLADSGLQVEFVSAVEGASLDRAAYPMAAGLSDGEVGCYLSHVSAWHRVARSSLDSALVLEDDVSLSGDIAGLCRELCLLPFEIDLVRLSSLKPMEGRDVWRLGPRRLLVPTGHPSGAQGYWLTRSGAQRLLACMSAPSQELDKALDRYWRHGLEVLLMDPPAVWEEGSDVSTIGQRASRPRPGKWPRRHERWRRRMATWLQARRVMRQIGVWKSAQAN